MQVEVPQEIKKELQDLGIPEVVLKADVAKHLGLFSDPARWGSGVCSRLLFTAALMIGLVGTRGEAPCTWVAGVIHEGAAGLAGYAPRHTCIQAASWV